MTQNYQIISLFTGCGGLDLGFLGDFKFLNHYFPKLSFDLIYANDFDQAACLTFEQNFHKPIVCADIEMLDLSKLPKADLVIGGFPCQDFSYAGNRKGLKTNRGKLYQKMVEAIKLVQPKVFLAENVKGLLTIEQGKIFQTMINDFEKLNYHVSYKLLKVSDFGVCQKRERIIIIGTQKKLLPKFNFNFLIKTKAQPVIKIIADLENLPEGAIKNHYWSKAKKNSGQGNLTIKHNDLAPTMRAEHHGNIEFHYNGKRRLSAREAARIQSFPDDFIFYPSTSSAYKQIGNAVPPVFA